MGRGRFHMTHDMMFLLSTSRSECQQYSHRLNRYFNCVINRGLAYINLHIVFVMVFTLIGGLVAASELFVHQ